MGFRNLGNESRRNADAELADRELEILGDSTVNWDELKPDTVDAETYEKLMAAVKEATDRNESIAQLKSRITQLGTEGVELAKTLVSLVP